MTLLLMLAFPAEFPLGVNELSNQLGLDDACLFVYLNLYLLKLLFARFLVCPHGEAAEWS